MASDPRIALAIRAPNAGQAFSSALTNIRNLDAIQQSRENAPFQNQLLQQRVSSGEQQAQQQQLLQKQKSVAIGSAEILPFLQNQDIEGARSTLLRRRQSLIDQGRPTETTDEALGLLDADPQLLQQRAQQGVMLGQKLGVFSGQIQATAGQRERQSLLDAINNPNSSDVAVKSAEVALGTRARAGSSSAERILESRDLTDKKIKLESDIAGGKEGAKLQKQLKFKPQITKAVKLAEAGAKARGETLTELARSEAALPGLINAVDQLKQLAPIATSTFGGRIFDFAVKESGFGSTKGATSRTKFIAIINNQVLPLLKETFGAAFTAQEGESLKATMGDPDVTPEEKMVQLDAFIDQKMRNIQSKQLELEQVVSATEQLNVVRFDAQGNIIQ